MAKTPFSPTEYATRKQARRVAQQAKADAIVALPAQERGISLLALWPQKLPKAIVLPKSLRSEWKQLKIMHELHRMGAFDGDGFQEDMDDATRMAVAEEAMEAHGEKISEIIALINALPGTKVVTVKVVDPASDNLEEPDYISGEMRLAGAIDETTPLEVLPLMAIGLATEGLIEVYHTLTKTVTRRNEAGIMETVPQVCVYALHLSGKEGVSLVSAKQLRERLSTDDDGDPVTFMPELSFGSFETLIRNAKHAAKARGGATLH